MEVWSAAAFSEAYNLLWKAEELAGVRFPRGAAGPLSVPAEATAALLMDKAGVPMPLIVKLSSMEQDRLRRWLMVARTLLMFPPYAARIEALMEKMPRFTAVDVFAGAPAKESACAVQTG